MDKHKELSDALLAAKKELAILSEKSMAAKMAHSQLNKDLVTALYRYHIKGNTVIWKDILVLEQKIREFSLFIKHELSIEQVITADISTIERDLTYEKKIITEQNAVTPWEHAVVRFNKLDSNADWKSEVLRFRIVATDYNKGWEANDIVDSKQKELSQ
jgi:hypothetical protein